MSARFAYFYFMADDPGRVRELAPQHTSHWQGLNLRDYSGGPFTDRTGGLITFVVDDPADADAAVAADPFVRADLLERYWLKRWDQPLATDAARPQFWDLQPRASPDTAAAPALRTRA